MGLRTGFDACRLTAWRGHHATVTGMASATAWDSRARPRNSRSRAFSCSPLCAVMV
jgi:hypothetical protein